MLRETDDPDADLALLREVREVLKAHPGHDPVRLIVQGQDQPTTLELSGIAVAPTDALLERVAELLGPGSVRVG